MAHPARESKKILLDWAEKASVLAVASLRVPLYYERLSILRVFQELGIPLYFEAALLLTGGLRCRPQLPCGRHGHAVASGMF